MARSKYRTPLLVVLGLISSSLSLIGGILGCAAFIVMLATGADSHELTGETGLPFVTVVMVSVAATALYGFLVYGLARARNWVRGLCLAHWALCAPWAFWSGVHAGSSGLGLVMAVLCGVGPGLLAFWYFFRRPNVVAYFEASSTPAPLASAA